MTDEPLARRADDTDEPLARRADDTDESLARRADDTDEPLARRADDTDESQESNATTAALEVIETALKESDLEYAFHEGIDGAPSGIVVEVPGERRLITNTIFSVGDHALRIEAFICRKPDEDHEKVYRYLLRRNRRLFGLAYTLDNLGDIYLVGRLALESVVPEMIDGILGQVVQAVEADFNMLLELGFHSSIQKEWDWRVKRGESLKNLRAFEHLIDEGPDDLDDHHGG